VTAQDDLDARLAALERAVGELQARAAEPSPEGAPTPDDELWALAGLRSRSPASGAVLYTGVVELPTGGAVQWQYGLPAANVLAQDWAELAPAIAALGHPVRLRILRAVLHGTTTVAALVAELDTGTSGQAYHHVRELTAAGWLVSCGRGGFQVPAARVVPLLAILVAAGTPG